MKKKEVIEHIMTPPCMKNPEVTCMDCALRFTHLCESDSKVHWLRRHRVRQLIEENKNGLDFTSKERCQITVLKAELNTINQEPKNLKNDNDRDWSFHVPLTDAGINNLVRSIYEQEASEVNA